MINTEFMVGNGLGVATVLFATWIFFRATLRVEPFTTVLILRFGRVLETVKTPGMHWRTGLLIPGTTRIRVSNALEGMRLEDIHVNDRDGTTMRIDLWVECRVNDAQAAVFSVESWRDSLKGVIKHSLMSAAGTRQFENIISARGHLVEEIRREASESAGQWGIGIESLSLQDIRVLPEVTRQLFNRVAAQIEMEKAKLEEEGRIAVHQLEAETERKISELRAQARSHGSLAVGRAYAELRKKPKVLESYEILHRLSRLQPGKTTSFVGFGADELSLLDAAMLPDTGLKGTPMKSTESGSH